MNSPRATMLLISYNQEDYIEEALSAAVAQDYPNLEIVVSDDASTDRTFEKIQGFFENYPGPHRIIINRNETNLGIGANLSKAVSMSSGELFFITAGDDISLPGRVTDVMRFWLDKGKAPDLIACHLLDMMQDGQLGDEIRIADLGAYANLDDWARNPPHVIGAAQAWTARLFERFGGIPAGVVGEDMLMAFRSIALGTAVTYPVPVVKYRRGGLTTKKKVLTVDAVIHGLTRKVKSSQIELHAMLATAASMRAGQSVIRVLQSRLNREVFIEEMFFGKERLRAFFLTGIGMGFRVRIFFYAFFPWVLKPFFMIKRFKQSNGGC
ncbi:glycosyltransferase [Chromobacterium subtsugae]|uniref:glycosyltransferase n=1 Tax=Chromobacterium subtsugae TaxID=251747 RepID=UPI0006416F56|nr:glycosyltransferase [Chromobacterium subtsugae]